MEGESKKRTCRRVNTAPTSAIPCQAPEGAKQLQAKPSQVLMKRLLDIFFFLIRFRTCHLGYEAETEGNLLGFFLTVTAALCSKHLHYLGISGYLCSCCYQK